MRKIDEEEDDDDDYDTSKDEGCRHHHPSVAGPIRDPPRSPTCPAPAVDGPSCPRRWSAGRSARVCGPAGEGRGVVSRSGGVLTGYDPPGQAILIDLCGEVGRGLAGIERFPLNISPCLPVLKRKQLRNLIACR